MGGRIPKSAQLAIDKANRNRQVSLAAKGEQIAALPTPRVMDVARTPRSIINLYDVFFNGEKQTLCTYANVDEGRIIRWSSGKGHRPLKGAELVQDLGKVEIRRKV